MLKQAVSINSIKSGMEVFDLDGERIGTVAGFREGEGTIKTTKTDAITIAETIREALGGKKRLSSALNSRLYSDGFIYIKRGFLRGNVIVYPDQIRTIEGNKINLEISNHEALKV